jgi:hypothetical protein
LKLTQTKNETLSQKTKKEEKTEPSTVAYACNLSYSGGGVKMEV